LILSHKAHFDNEIYEDAAKQKPSTIHTTFASRYT